MRTPDYDRWIAASSRLREALRGRKDREALEDLVDALERAALRFGREIEQHAQHLAPAKSRPH